MSNTEKRRFWNNREKNIESRKWKNGKTNYSSKKSFILFKKNRENNSAIETKFDHYDNKFSMFETVK